MGDLNIDEMRERADIVKKASTQLKALKDRKSVKHVKGHVNTALEGRWRIYTKTKRGEFFGPVNIHLKFRDDWKKGEFIIRDGRRNSKFKDFKIQAPRVQDLKREIPKKTDL